MNAVSRPYVGPQPFETGARQRFFGREAETLTIFQQWSAEPLTVLYGPPGVGKTSLIQAAIAPLALGSSGEGRVILLDGQIVPIMAPPASDAPNPFVLSLLTSWSQGDPSVNPTQLTIANFLRQLRATEQPPIFATIDRFECLFRDDSSLDQDRSDFLGQLIEAAQQVPSVHLLLSVREDSVPELERRLGRLHKHRLGALAPDAAHDAVARPVHGSGRSFAAGVAEEIVLNLRTSQLTSALGASRPVVADTVEPAQLQVVCATLWEALPDEADVITLEHLYGQADIDGALTRFCEHVTNDVAVTNELSKSELSTWLARTFMTDRGTRDTAYEGVTSVAGMPRKVADQFVDRHVLSTESRLGSRWYKLPNDRLIAPVQEAAERYDAGDRVAGGISPVSSLTAAEGALAAGNLVLATRRAIEAVRTSGSHDVRTRAAALSCLGRVAAKGGNDQQAESYYGAAAELSEAMQDQAGTGRLLAELGRVLLRRGRYAEAVAALQGAEARLPSNVTIRVDLARALRDSGQLWAATAVLGAALTVEPGTVEALIERGLIRITTGEFSSALDDLDNAVRLQPSVGQQADIQSARELARIRLGRTA